MLFALTPFITYFDAKDVNSDTSWMGCHFCRISANVCICGTYGTPLKSSLQYASLEEIASGFQASLTLQSVENACADLYSVSSYAPLYLVVYDVTESIGFNTCFQL